MDYLVNPQPVQTCLFDHYSTGVNTCMTVRDFHADLAVSDRPEVVAAITAACHGYWPELLSVHRAHTTNDKMGADYWLEFPGCKMETLDAKVRRDDYALRGDDRTACLELVANTRSGKPGWTVDPSKLTDWIIFYYIETGSSFVYSARQLRAAVIAQLPELQKTGKPAIQSTKSGAGSYQSESLFVSHRELGAAIYRNAHKRLAACTCCPIYHSSPNNRTAAFWRAIQDAMAIMRFTGLPWLTFEHDGKSYEVKPSGISKRICGARKKDGSNCRSKALHRGGKCKFHGGLSTGAKTPEGRARAIAAMRAGWVRWQTAKGNMLNKPITGKGEQP